MNTLEYTWEDATITGLGLGSPEQALGWTVVLGVEYTLTPYNAAVVCGPPDNWAPANGGEVEFGDATVVNLWHHGEPVEVTKNHQLYWSSRFERDVAYTDSFRDELYEHAEAEGVA